MRRVTRLLVFLLLGLPAALNAAPRLVSTSGVFGSNAPISLWSTPNRPWTLTFVIDEQPVVTNSSPGFFFRISRPDIRYGGLLYTVNGRVVPLPDGFVYVYGGMSAPFGICFNAGCTRGFQMKGPQQVYSGPESAPTILTGTFPQTQLTLVLPGVGNFDQPPGVIYISEGAAGTVTRAIGVDEFNDDDNIGGTVGQLYSKNFASAGGTQAAYGLINNALSVGAWSNGTDGAGAARAIAFRSYRNTTSAVKQVRANAILEGHFEAAPWNLPNGQLWVGGMVHILDATDFSMRLAASGQPEQFLVGGYPLSTARFPTQAFDLLTNRLGSAVLASDSETIHNGPAGQQITLALETGLVAIQPGQVFTILFDITTSSVAATFGGRTGAGSVAFLDTLTAAPDFFTDAGGVPVAGIEAIGPPAALPPVATNLALTATGGSQVAGSAQTVTATVLDATGAPVTDALIRFDVTAGANVGVTGGAESNANGQAAFTYTGFDPGTDTVTARINDLVSNAVEVSWTAPACASNVSSQVTVTRSGYRLNRGTTTYAQTVTLTNNGAPLAGAAFALDGLNNGVTLQNAAGTTSCAAPAGSPFVVVPTLASGQTVTMVLQFSNPSQTAIAYQARVLSGAEAR